MKISFIDKVPKVLEVKIDEIAKIEKSHLYCVFMKFYIFEDDKRIKNLENLEKTIFIPQENHRTCFVKRKKQNEEKMMRLFL